MVLAQSGISLKGGVSLLTLDAPSIIADAGWHLSFFRGFSPEATRKARKAGEAGKAGGAEGLVDSIKSGESPTIRLRRLYVNGNGFINDNTSGGTRSSGTGRKGSEDGKIGESGVSSEDDVQHAESVAYKIRSFAHQEYRGRGVGGSVARRRLEGHMKRGSDLFGRGDSESLVFVPGYWDVPRIMRLGLYGKTSQQQRQQQQQQQQQQQKGQQQQQQQKGQQQSQQSGHRQSRCIYCDSPDLVERGVEGRGERPFVMGDDELFGHHDTSSSSSSPASSPSSFVVEVSDEEAEAGMIGRYRLSPHAIAKGRRTTTFLASRLRHPPENSTGLGGDRPAASTRSTSISTSPAFAVKRWSLADIRAGRHIGLARELSIHASLSGLCCRDEVGDGGGGGCNKGGGRRFKNKGGGGGGGGGGDVDCGRDSDAAQVEVNTGVVRLVGIYRSARHLYVF